MGKKVFGRVVGEKEKKRNAARGGKRRSFKVIDPHEVGFSAMVDSAALRAFAELSLPGDMDTNWVGFAIDSAGRLTLYRFLKLCDIELYIGTLSSANLGPLGAPESGVKTFRFPLERFRRVVKAQAKLAEKVVPVIITRRYFMIGGKGRSNIVGELFPAKSKMESYLESAAQSSGKLQFSSDEMRIIIRLCDALKAEYVYTLETGSSLALVEFYDREKKTSVAGFVLRVMMHPRQDGLCRYTFRPPWFVTCG